MAAASPHAPPTPTDRRPEGRAGSRRIFPPQFKLQVLESYRRDAQCRGNQRATARKFGIHRRQIQKWLQAEPALRAALLRRAPQPAPSPPPYSAGSPESARLPSPPPSVIAMTSPVALPTPAQMATPQQPSLETAPPPPQPVHLEPIDLSVRRASPPPQSAHIPPMFAPEPPRKPFKLFRPYLLEEESEKQPKTPVFRHVSAFIPVQPQPGIGMVGCSLAAYPTPSWCAPLAAYPAPPR